MKLKTIEIYGEKFKLVRDPKMTCIGCVFHTHLGKQKCSAPIETIEECFPDNKTSYILKKV